MNRNGFSLMEVMVVAAIAGTISLFAFESVKPIIKGSIGIRKKADFNGLVEEIRGITNKLDQCSCNFMGFNINPNAAATTVRNAELLRYEDPQGDPPCQGNTEIVAKQNEYKYESLVTRLELQNLQYLARMNLLRASIFIEAQPVQNRSTNTRRLIPVMFSTTPAGGGVQIQGCIGMTR